MRTVMTSERTEKLSPSISPQILIGPNLGMALGLFFYANWPLVDDLTPYDDIFLTMNWPNPRSIPLTIFA